MLNTPDKKIWLNGSPAILIPENTKAEWLGCYSTTPLESDVVEFEHKGTTYYLIDEFDSVNPQSDYDNICRINKTHLIQLSNGNEALVLFMAFDKISWNTQFEVFTNGIELDETVINKLEWKQIIEHFKIKTPQMLLMNSCYTLIDPYFCDDDQERINFSLGDYKVFESYYEKNGVISNLYKLQKG